MYGNSNGILFSSMLLIHQCVLLFFSVKLLVPPYFSYLCVS
jgi:hypothetical protein